MTKKFKARTKNFTSPGKSHSFVYPHSLPDPIEEERRAQQQEHLRKQQQEEDIFLGNEPARTQPQFTRNSSSENTIFDKSLERTWQWIEQTFPFLFDPTNPIKPLDKHIIRDIKDHYRKYHLKNRYPKDLVIKAALHRYMIKPEYLHCLQAGTSRYDCQGNPTDKVTEAEQEEALKILKFTL